ncbi:NADH-quinone oxidoreductase subunit NuoG [Hydrogenophilus thermoluteolus]|uniref:NADH-quinone oxidoreductase subunit NuoG n=1 Tax=Hydrogenophilus thermoluteolus TaxID=297 RepID=UPI003F67C7F0
MLTLEIDGKPVEVEDGATVMDAANKLGIYIPHFCYHKKLSIAANCRMCLVEVERAPKPLPACATPATNGMKVWTHSRKAITAQKGVMEFLLINHPLDCPICDQGGECQLQDLAVGYGQSAHRFAEEKRVVADKNLGPLIDTFMTRCINCTRCVRFLAEIGGFQELGQAFRGEHAEILPFLGETVHSEVSGNVIDLCPVGALTSKPFLYQARTWELTRRRSISPHDAWGSNLIVQSKHDAVKRVLPLEFEAINECWLADRDRFAYEGLNAADRLTRPMVKTDGRWVEVAWQTALEVAANRLASVAEENGSDALAFLAHPMSTVEELYLLKALGAAFGAAVDTRIRQRDARADLARGKVAWLNGSITEIVESDGHWFLGADVRRELPLMAVRLRAAAKAGARIVRWDDSDDDWRIPGVDPHKLTAPAMLVALAHFAKHLGVTLPDWAVGLVQQPSPLSAAEFDALSAALRGAQKRRIWLGRPLRAHPNAAEFEWLAEAIAGALGAKLGWLVDGANAVGAAVVGAQATQTAHQLASAGKAGYLLVNLEPEDFAAPDAVADSFARARTVVALTPYASESLKAAADVLLPIAPFTETSGTLVNIEGRLQSFTAVVRPLEMTRPGWKVLAALTAMRTGRSVAYTASDAVRDAALPQGWRTQLAQHGLTAIAPAPTLHASAIPAFDRVTLYQGDMIVRRSASLQATDDAKAERGATIPSEEAAA